MQSGIIYFVKETIPALSGALIAIISKKQEARIADVQMQAAFG